MRELREGLGWTQARLSEETGIDRARIAQIEGGRVALPGADVRRRLAKALGVSHLDLLIAAGELTAAEVADAGKTGVVEREPDDPREQLIARIRRLRWTEGVQRSLSWAVGILEQEQGIRRE